jgi:pyridoxal phosphate enzyme (YggS family)
MSIAENLARVRERIARTAEKVGRRSDEVTLVGVTKYVGAVEAAELAAAGCLDLGESRPQELWQKAGEVAAVTGLSGHSIRWHLVGHLQRNKIRRTLPLVHMIHSVDSERLLAGLEEELKREVAHPTGREAGRKERLRVLLEVNTSGESAKHGLSPEGVEPLLALARQFRQIEICGLMTMASLEGGASVAARNFAALRKLRDQLRPLAPEGVRLDELSMGMSGDFETAIQEGATIVRIGSLLWAN